MIGNLTTALTPVGIALGIVAVFVGVPLLLGRTIALADRIDDGADVQFSEPHEQHVRQAIAVGNDEPDPDFLARTRRLVVDELAQRRGAVSS
jgi:hypothetical protein